MEYKDFVTETGIEIDSKTFNVIVLGVYNNVPPHIYGDVGFFKWVEKNGGMDFIRAIYPICWELKCYKEKQSRIDEMAIKLKCLSEFNKSLLERINPNLNY